MHLNSEIKSNPGNYIAALVDQQAPKAENYVGVAEFLYGCPYKSASCPRVPAVRNFVGRRVPRHLNSAGAYAYLLTYLVGATAQVHFFSRRRHSSSRRYNSTIQDYFFIASYTVILGLQQTIQTMHPALSCCFMSCIFSRLHSGFLRPPGVAQFQRNPLSGGAINTRGGKISDFLLKSPSITATVAHGCYGTLVGSHRWRIDSCRFR